MYSLQKLLPRKDIAVWQIFVCLAVIAFVCRSVIPNGYMPALSGEKNGTVILTLCSADGSNRTLLLNLQNHSKKSPNDGHASQECPFGLVMSHGILPLQDVPALVAMVQRDHIKRVPERNLALPPLPALGPPLGSRAPPTNLG